MNFKLFPQKKTIQIFFIFQLNYKKVFMKIIKCIEIQKNNKLIMFHYNIININNINKFDTNFQKIAINDVDTVHFGNYL